MIERRAGTRPDINKSALYTLAFIMGMCGMGYEYTFSKIASDLMGQTVTQWAVVIGLMMFAMGLGADYQKKISDKNLLEKFVVFEVLLSLLGSWGALFLVYSFGEMRDYFKLIQYTTSVGVGFLIGMEIPILARLNAANNSIKENLASVFKFDYLGGFVGALAWAFVMVRLADTILQVAFFLSLINLLGVIFVVKTWFVPAKVSIIKFNKLSEEPRNEVVKTVLLLRQGLVFLLVVVLLALSWGMYSVKSWTPALEQKLFRDKVIFSKTTKYQHLTIIKNHFGDLSLYINGNLQFSSRDEKVYHEWLVHPAFLMNRTQPTKVLVLGGGDGLAVREILRYPKTEVTLVELDKEMVKLAQTQSDLVRLNQGSLLDPRVKGIRIYNQDAKQWVAELQDKFEVIILDFPDPNSLELSSLYSLSFYKNIRLLLAKGGVLVQQASSPFYAKETFLVIGRTMKKAGFNVLPYQTTVPSFGPWGWWLAMHGNEDHDLKDRWLRLTKVASTSGDLANLSQWPSSVPKLTVLTPEFMRGGVAFPKNGLVSKYKDYNTLLNHRAYRYYELDTKSFWW